MAEIVENQSLDNQNVQNSETETVDSKNNSTVQENLSGNIAENTSDNNTVDNEVKSQDTLSDQNDYKSLVDVIQKIADAKEKLNSELNSKKQYLSENLSKYDSENYFQNDSFKNLYSEAFSALGTNLDTDKFVKLLDDYVKSRIDLNSKKLAAIKENDKATDSMNFQSGISNKSDKKPKMQELSDDELQKYIAKYV